MTAVFDFSIHQSITVVFDFSIHQSITVVFVPQIRQTMSAVFDFLIHSSTTVVSDFPIRQSITAELTASKFGKIALHFVSLQPKILAQNVYSDTPTTPETIRVRTRHGLCRSVPVRRSFVRFRNRSRTSSGRRSVQRASAPAQ